MAAGGGGAWKVAYADFVTAMMAFFLVMWIVGLSKPVRAAIAAYFQNPALFDKNGGRKVIGEADETKLANPAPISSTDTAKLQAQFRAKAAAILHDLEKSPEFKNMHDSIQVHLTNEGLRIELMEKTSSLFFGTGSAKLNPIRRPSLVRWTWMLSCMFLNSGLFS